MIADLRAEDKMKLSRSLDEFKKGFHKKSSYWTSFDLVMQIMNKKPKWKLKLFTTSIENKSQEVNYKEFTLDPQNRYNINVKTLLTTKK